jgi:hypothetical protein
MEKFTIRRVINKALVSAAVLAFCVFPGVAHARPQSYFQGSVTLPYQVNWGLAVLEPGEYSIFTTSVAGPTRIVSKAGTQSVLIEARFTNQSKNGPTCLIITVSGKEHAVRSMNLPELGVSFVYKPLTRIQREAVARAGQIRDDVVAITAMK